MGVKVEKVGGLFILRKGLDQALVLSETEALGLLVKLRRELGWREVEDLA